MAHRLRGILLLVIIQSLPAFSQTRSLLCWVSNEDAYISVVAPDSGVVVAPAGSDSARARATFWTLPSLASPYELQTYSLESAVFPGCFLTCLDDRLVLRHRTGRDSAFAVSASFIRRNGLVGGVFSGTVSYECINRPGHYICVSGSALVIDSGGGATFNASATFYNDPPLLPVQLHGEDDCSRSPLTSTCCCFRAEHQHDLGTTFGANSTLEVKYRAGTPGGTCQASSGYVSVSTNLSSWTQVGTFAVPRRTVADTTHTLAYHPSVPFRYVSVRIPTCYNDYSSAEAWATVCPSFALAPSPRLPPYAAEYRTPVRFDWRSTGCAAQYRVQVALDSLFTAPLALDTTLIDTPLVSRSLTVGSTYYWHVQSINHNGQASVWSDTWSFTVLPALPGIPALLAPANGDTARNSSVHFVWSRPEGDPTSYTLTYSTAPDLSHDNHDTTLADTAATIDGFTDNTTYYWRVQATNAHGAGPIWYPNHFTCLLAVPVRMDMGTAPRVTSRPGASGAVVQCALPAGAHLLVRVLDLQGRVKAVLCDGYRATGTHAFALPPTLAAGTASVVEVRVGDMHEYAVLACPR